MNEYDWLRANPEYIDILKDAVRLEESIDESEWEGSSILENHNEKHDTDHTVCWENTDLPYHPTKVYQLETRGFLDRVFDSNSTTRYSMVDRDEVKEKVNELEAKFDGDAEIIRHSFPDKDDIEGIFDDVVGYGDVKWLLKEALTSDDIVNILLVGPPGSGKTVFLRCIEKLEDSSFINGSKTTESGFADEMFDNTPRFMCIDELDDMDSNDQVSLADYTEDGILTETKGNDRRRELRINTKTFATANDTGDIIDQIDNRFTDLHFDRYSLDEFIQVCKNILPREYGHTEESSKEIAEAVWDIDGFANVRKAEDVASLSRDADPKRVVSVLENYSANNSRLLS